MHYLRFSTLCCLNYFRLIYSRLFKIIPPQAILTYLPKTFLGYFRLFHLRSFCFGYFKLVHLGILSYYTLCYFLSIVLQVIFSIPTLGYSKLFYLKNYFGLFQVIPLKLFLAIPPYVIINVKIYTLNSMYIHFMISTNNLTLTMSIAQQVD